MHAAYDVCCTDQSERRRAEFSRGEECHEQNIYEHRKRTTERKGGGEERQTCTLKDRQTDMNKYGFFVAKNTSGRL